MMPYGQQTQELIQAAFPLSQVVIGMVIQVVLAPALSFGVLLRIMSMSITPGTATCSPLMRFSGTRTTSALSQWVTLSVASWIDN